MKKAGTDVRPFSWRDLDGAPPRDGEGASPGSPQPERGESAAVRPYRWGELEGGVAAVGSLTGVSAGTGAVPERVPSPDEMARREAEAILDAAREEARELREVARAEGFEAGKAQGRDALVAAAEKLEAVVVALTECKPALYEQAREQVIELALALVGRLLGPLAEGDAQAVVRVVERALLLLSDRETLTLRVHPEDLRSLLDAKPHLLETFDGIQKLTVLEDPAVRRGGCLVQTPASEIDARLETQLAELARTLRSP